MVSREQFEVWYIAQARKQNTALNAWSDDEVRDALMARRPGDQEKYGSYGVPGAQMAWEAWQASREAMQLKPVAWMDTDTLQTMQATAKTSSERWPVVKLSEWDSKTAHTGLCVVPTT